MQRGQRVFDGEQAAGICVTVQLIIAYDCRDCAFLQGRRDKVVAVEALTLDREKYFAHTDSTRVDGISLSDFFRE